MARAFAFEISNRIRGKADVEIRQRAERGRRRSGVSYL